MTSREAKVVSEDGVVAEAVADLEDSEVVVSVVMVRVEAGSAPTFNQQNRFTHSDVASTEEAIPSRMARNFRRLNACPSLPSKMMVVETCRRMPINTPVTIGVIA